MLYASNLFCKTFSISCSGRFLLTLYKFVICLHTSSMWCIEWLAYIPATLKHDRITAINEKKGFLDYWTFNTPLVLRFISFWKVELVKSEKMKVFWFTPYKNFQHKQFLRLLGLRLFVVCVCCLRFWRCNMSLFVIMRFS